MYGLNLRPAIQQMVVEEFETNMDLWMPHGFKFEKSFYNYRFVISGPVYGNGWYSHRNGIHINISHKLMGTVKTALPEFNHIEYKGFEYADPKFIEKLAAYVSNQIGAWMMYNETQQKVPTVG